MILSPSAGASSGGRATPLSSAVASCVPPLMALGAALRPRVAADAGPGGLGAAGRGGARGGAGGLGAGGGGRDPAARGTVGLRRRVRDAAGHGLDHLGPRLG